MQHQEPLTVFQNFIQALTALLAHPETPLAARIVFGEAACLFAHLSTPQCLAQAQGGGVHVPSGVAHRLLLKAFASQLAHYRQAREPLARRG